MEIRENRVVILGAGIGAMAMGFENASCKVVLLMNMMKELEIFMKTMQRIKHIK